MDAKYKKYLGSNEWKNIRNKRLERDGFKCVCCGAAANLEVHHTTYDRIGNENIEDLITLCKDCHKAIHNSRDKIKTGWSACLADGNLDIVDMSAFSSFFEYSFGARGRVLSYLLLDRSERNIVIGSMKDISYSSKASLTTVVDTIKGLRVNNLVKTRNNALMFNPDHIKARDDDGDGKLQKEYAKFDERVSYKKYCDEEKP